MFINTTIHYIDFFISIIIMEDELRIGFILMKIMKEKEERKKVKSINHLTVNNFNNNKNHKLVITINYHQLMVNIQC